MGGIRAHSLQMSFNLDDALAAMARARDAETAGNILQLNIARFPAGTAKLRLAYLQRFSELRDTTSSLEQDVWTSMELACRVLGTRFNPESRNPQQMPEMVRKHGAVEAVRRTIVNQGKEGTSFFQKCAEAGNLAFTSEAICLRHGQLFDEKTRAVAQARLDRYPTLPR